METTFSRAADAAAFLADNPAMGDAVKRHGEATRLIRTLCHMRMDMNLTQRQLAERMGVSPSKLCRMEAAVDADLRWGDVVAYVGAMGMSMRSVPARLPYRHRFCAKKTAGPSST